MFNHLSLNFNGHLMLIKSSLLKEHCVFVLFFQTKMKQLEQEAHRAAGEIFLITSNTQLRAVCIFVYVCR